MVMHARKHPRLNDGYYDRHASPKDRNDRVPRTYDRNSLERDGYRVSPIDKHSSPKQSRKLTYIGNIHPERYNRGYGRDGRRSSSDLDRRQEYSSRRDSDYIRGDSRNDRSDGRNDRGDSRNDRSDRLKSNHYLDDRGSSNRDYRRESYSTSESTRHTNNSHTGTSQSRHDTASQSRHESTSQSQRHDRESRDTRDTNQQSNQTSSTTNSSNNERQPVRTCGDWSEYVSNSSGKIYYYNHITEISQWVRPDDWTINDKNNSENGETQKSNSDAKTRERKQKDKSDRRRDSVSSDSDSHKHDSSHGSDDDMDISPDGSPRVNSTTSSRTDSSSKSTYHSQPVTRQDSSSCSQPAARVNSSHRDSSSHKDNSSRSKPDSSCGKNEKSQSENKSNVSAMMLGQALQTLQTLKEVLNRKTLNTSQEEEGSQSSPHSTPTHHDSEHHVKKAQRSRRSTESKSACTTESTRTHENASHKTVRSSTQSTEKQSEVSETSQHSNNDDGSKKEEGNALAPFYQPIILPPSLINHYDPNLLGHISGWASQLIEQKAQEVCNESLLITAHHCGQISAELKQNRSLVRINEIQSTLFDSRIDFLRKQMNELESDNNTIINTKHPT